MGTYTIGELAGSLALNPRTLRYYEAIGLLRPQRKPRSSYRVYSDVDVERIHLIRAAKLAGLSLTAIKEILAVHAINGLGMTMLGSFLITYWGVLLTLRTLLR